MADLTVPRGDYGYYLLFTVQDSNEDAFDLTDYTIVLKVWSADRPRSLLVEGSCNIVSAGDGTCQYLVASGDFSIVGFYTGELELSQAGAVESTRNFTIEVEESG